MRDADFERLYDAHAQPLFAFLLYRTGDRTLAEDIVADTFERALKARRRFNPRRGSEKTWLYAIALNRLRDHQRHRSVEHRVLAGVGVGDDEADDTMTGRVEHRDQLQRALGRLSVEEREAVALRYGADLSAPEIARVLGERLTTVEGRIYRALRKLRGELGEP